MVYSTIHRRLVTGQRADSLDADVVEQIVRALNKLDGFVRPLAREGHCIAVAIQMALVDGVVVLFVQIWLLDPENLYRSMT